MPDDYGQLLEATIQHLEDLKSHGVRHVAIAPETLRALAQPPAAKSQISNPKFQMDKASALPQELSLALPGETPALDSRPSTLD